MGLRMISILFAASVIAIAAPAFAKGKKPSRSNATVAMQALIKADWSDQLDRDPIFASRSGIESARDKMPSALPADAVAAAQRDADRLAALMRIPRASLTHTDQINASLFETMLSDRVAHAHYRPWRMPMTSDSGFQSEVLYMHQGQPFKAVSDYEAYIRRLAAAEKYVDDNIANMRQGLKDGFTLASEILDGVEENIRAQQFKSGEECPLYEPFMDMPTGVAPDIQASLKAKGKAAIERHIIPAFARLKTFLETEYRAGARTTLGASELPDGAAYYQSLIASFTTTDMSAAQIHTIGLAEVARIRKEMDGVISATGFRGSFPEFLEFLRTDPQFYPRSADDLLMRASLIAKRIDGKLPEFVATLPRLSYGVEPVPEALAPNYTAGRYNPPPPGGKRAGFYWVNIFKPDSRALYNLPALTLHEAVPGHHLQIALAMEQSDVPEFRKQLYLVAFGEGWALYAEKLGAEMGIYQTPYEHFGRLTYEMWRACRLVVDTGIHAKGWSRKQAQDYLAENTALSLREVKTEIDRYISWPGQALGYKLGELRIVELRAKAEHALGTRFDLRRFHDAVLANGSVTLNLLTAEIDAFIARELAAKAPTPSNAQ